MPIGVGAPNPSGFPGFNTINGLTAHASGGQTNALPLPAYLNEVAVVATANDSVMLPPGYAGAAIVVINDGANSLQVYGSNLVGPGDTIAAHGSSSQSATATGVAQAAASIATYFCFIGQGGTTSAPTAASWKQFLTA